jgi:cysteine desulfurase
LDRTYLDYNATSPLAPAVKSWLAKGDFVFANPASQHSSGKKAAYEIDLVTDRLYELFHLSQKDFKLVFHSGATEAVNTAVLSLALSQNSLVFFYSPLDHACVRNQVPRLLKLGHKCEELVVGGEGDLDVHESIKKINGHTGSLVLVNFTWVHNETGVVWPLSLAEKIKSETKALIHVDAPQAIGKVADCFKLNSVLDFYSFSSHKCGGLKNHGWSFVHRSWPYHSLIVGGDQQRGLRSGTENSMAATALRLALDELEKTWKPETSQGVILEMREFFDEKLQGIGFRVARSARELNLNTIMFVLNSLPSDMSLPLFDLAGLEVSSGAACSSGAAKESHVLLGLGHKVVARNGIRLSVAPDFDFNDWSLLRPKIVQVFEKIAQP